MGLIVNHELNFTKVRFHQLASVVDIFVILESSISSGNYSQGPYSNATIKQAGSIKQAGN